jgi:hypothetical protein
LQHALFAPDLALHLPVTTDLIPLKFLALWHLPQSFYYKKQLVKEL